MNKLEEMLNRKIEDRKKGIQAVCEAEHAEADGLDMNSSLALVQKMMENTKEGWRIDSYRPLNGSGPVGKAAAFLKKVLRKSIHWYIEPVCDDQTVYNRKLMNAVEALGSFAQAQIEENKRIEKKYREELEFLKNRIDMLEQQKGAADE